MKARWTGSSETGPLWLAAEGIAPVPGSPAAFLDRDGTLNEAVPDAESGLPESPLKLEDVRLLPAVAGPVKKLADAGFVLVCVSNQPAAAKGKINETQLLEVHEKVVSLLAEQGVCLSASVLCLHHPDGAVGGLARRCDCRKPSPGMLVDAAAALRLDLTASWMLGDTDVDVSAGRAAGCRTGLIEYPGSAHKRGGEVSPDVLARDLGGAVAQLLARRDG